MSRRRKPYVAKSQVRSHRYRYEVATAAWRDQRVTWVSPRWVSGLLLVLVGWVLYWFWNTDVFYVQALQVEGEGRLSAAELLQVTGLEGVSIFWVDTGAAERAIEALPEVASARMRCSLPARCVVHVVARPPLLVWQQGQAQIWVGADGVALPARGSLPDALVLDASGSTALKPGDRVSPELLQAVQTLAHLQPDVRMYRYSDRYGLSFYNDYGWLVRLGHQGDMATRLQLVRALSDYLAAQGVTPAYIDVRYPEAPYYGK